MQPNSRVTQSPGSFEDEQSAALFLLRESTGLLTENCVNFVVVGGWAPFLFHRHRFGHPGTFDVDVLLESISLDNGTFSRATDAMLSAGYLRAAKNDFQAHRILRVRNEEIIFHVDFLNDQHPGNAIELVSGNGRVRSIYTPVMEAILKYGQFRFAPDTALPDVRFPSPQTFIASKAAATRVAKRTRDAFDVFITIADQDSSSFDQHWDTLVKTDGLFQDANDDLWEAVHHGDAVEKILAVLTQLCVSPLPTPGAIETKFQFLQQPADRKQAPSR